MNSKYCIYLIEQILLTDLGIDAVKLPYLWTLHFTKLSSKKPDSGEDSFILIGVDLSCPYSSKFDS